MRRAFISYSSRDIDFARTTQDILESSPLGFTVWRDERSIERDWSGEIASALVESDVLVLLWSGMSAASRWVRNEWLTGRALMKPIVPVLLEAGPLPEALANLHGVVVRGGEIPGEMLRKRLSSALAEPPVYDFTIRPPGFRVPLGPNRDFVGREADLVELYLAVLGNLNKVGVRSVGIVGMGGVGKTQLTVEFAHRFAYAFEGVHWITATDSAEWLPKFLDLARSELPISAEKGSAPTTDHEWILALRDYCARHPQLLLIMDNVVDPNRLVDGDSLLGIAPLDLGCNVLFTTRRQFNLPGVSSHTVGVLGEEEAHGLLTARRQPAGEAETGHARAVCSAVGYLPLALVLASAFLGRYLDVSFEAYRRRLEESALDTVDVQKLTPAQLATRHRAAVRATFEEQWTTLESADARALFLLAGLLREGEVAPKRLLGLLAGVEQDPDALIRPLDDASLLLEDLSLADAADGGRGLRLHPLLHQFACGLIEDPDGMRAKAADRLATAYTDVTRLEREYADRGVSAVIEDVALGLEWAEAESAADKLRPLKRVLDAESSAFYRFGGEARPALFLQQLANRAATLGFSQLQESARRRLAEGGLPHFAQLWRTQRASPELARTLVGHRDWVNQIALTPDGRRIVTASEDGSVAVWDLTTGRLIERLTGHEGAVRAVDVLGDGGRVLSGGEDGTLRLWDLATSRELHVVSAHEGEVQAVTAYPEGDQVLSIGGRDGRLRVWRLADLDAPRDVAVLEGGADALALMPDLRHVLAARFADPEGGSFAGSRGLIDLWDVDAGRCVWTREAHEYVIDAILVSPDGSLVVTCGRDDRVRMWEFESWNEVGGLEATDPGALALLSSDSEVVVGSAREVLVVDVQSRQVLRRLRGHSGHVGSLAVAPDKRTIVSGGADDTVRVWDLDADFSPQTPAPTGHSEAVTTVLALGENAVTGDIKGELRLWAMRTGALEGTWNAFGMRKHALPANGERVVLSSSADLEGGSIELLNLTDLSEHSVWPTGGRVEVLMLDSEERTLVVAGGGSPTISLVEVGDMSNPTAYWQSVGRLIAPADYQSIDAAAMTPDRSLLVAAASRSFGGIDALFLFDIATEELIAFSPGIEERIVSTTITPNGDLVSFVSANGQLAVWEPGKGKDARVLANDLGSDPKLAALGDGRVVVTGGADVKVWNLETGRADVTLGGHPGVWHLSVLNDRGLLTASADWTVSLWDIETRSEVATIAFDDEARKIGVAPDGATFVAGDGGGDVYAFEIARSRARGPTQKDSNGQMRT
jgi:WD40 repeat protein